MPPTDITAEETEPALGTARNISDLGLIRSSANPNDILFLATP